ncbi:prolactin regulatory element-binding protein isoform X2 [Hypomesus transpacificus]|uniref:prolactin regulatory element-binding protein isoform X2 n=1 Tax=Hypomesus transpacificus TaxID=137520 RepID=UPI001F080F1E|nr:prolactin regulatory element-binding protein isoform X2 [Hypomesus transpacificus]
MGRRKVPDLYRAPFPLYTVKVDPTTGLVITAGGGGASKTGIKNALHFLGLGMSGGQFTATLLHTHDTETRATMNMALGGDVIAAGQDGSCCLMRFRRKEEKEGRKAAATEGGSSERGGTRRRAGRGAREGAAGGDTKEDTPQICVEGVGEVQSDLNPQDPLQKVVRFSPDLSLLLVGGTDGHIRVWEYPSLKEKYDFKAHKGEVEDLDISEDNKHLVTVGRDMACSLWCGTQLNMSLDWSRALPQVAERTYRYQACRYPHTALQIPGLQVPSYSPTDTRAALQVPSYSPTDTRPAGALIQPYRYQTCRYPHTALQIPDLQVPSYSPTDTRPAGTLIQPYRYQGCRCPHTALQIPGLQVPSYSPTDTRAALQVPSYSPTDTRPAGALIQPYRYQGCTAGTLIQPYRYQACRCPHTALQIPGLQVPSYSPTDTRAAGTLIQPYRYQTCRYPHTALQIPGLQVPSYSPTDTRPALQVPSYSPTDTRAALQVPSYSHTDTRAAGVLIQPYRYQVCRCPHTALQMPGLQVPSYSPTDTRSAGVLIQPYRYQTCRYPHTALQIPGLQVPSYSPTDTRAAGTLTYPLT